MGLPGTVTWFQLISLGCTGLALFFHGLVIGTNFWRNVTLNRGVLQRDGLWLTCKVTPEAGYAFVCEDLPEAVVGTMLKVARGAAIIATILMVGTGVCIVGSLIKARLVMRHETVLKFAGVALILNAVSMIICAVAYGIDTGLEKSKVEGDLKMSLSWGYHVDLAAIGLGFVAILMLGIHLKLKLDEDDFHDDYESNQLNINIISNDNFNNMRQQTCQMPDMYSYNRQGMHEAHGNKGMHGTPGMYGSPMYSMC